jgi:hypothetical protein
MQLPAQAVLPELYEFAEKLRAIEPPLAEGCDGSEIERDRGRLVAAIIAIVFAVKNFIEALDTYKRHWPKGPRGRWGAAFELIASRFGSSSRTLYRFIKSVAKGCKPGRKRKRKVERPEEGVEGNQIVQEQRAESRQRPDSVGKTTTVTLKQELGDELVRQLRTRAGAERKVDLVEKLARMIEMTLPVDDDGKKEEAQKKIMVALTARLGGS